jgi:protein O-GlcNAc transferase
MKARKIKSVGTFSAEQEMLAAAVRLLKAGRHGEARAAYRALLAAHPENVLGLHHLSVIEHQLGQSEVALRLLSQCLGLRPDYAIGHSDRAVMLMQSGRDAEAIEACETAIALNPKLAAAYSNLGDLRRRRGEVEAAERAYARAVALQPNFAAAHASRADALAALDRLIEAKKANDKALRLAPDLAIAHGVNGLIRHKEGDLDGAIAAYRRAIDLDPRLAVVHTRLANVLKDAGCLDEALAANARALHQDPACVPAYANQAAVMKALGRRQEALEYYSNALTLDPAFTDALAGLGLLLHGMGDLGPAVEVLRRAVRSAPDAAHVRLHLASVLKDQGRLGEAAEVYSEMARTCGEILPAQGLFDQCSLRRHICDWAGLDAAEMTAIAALDAGREAMPPFASLAMGCTPIDHLRLARRWAAGFRSGAQVARWPRIDADGTPRIKLGYLSSDFCQHATASLIAELIERHDRDRFEVFAYCFSPEDGSAMRSRLTQAFDHFRLIESLPHPEAARLIASDRIDILLDLKGHTRNARTMILAHRPAPVQVNYLGYPGTMGAPFMDYIIGDPVVTPMEHTDWFDEKIVQLPDCYQPNDRQRRASASPGSRADHGLPEAGFIFCSFNNAYKITEPVFDTWMRLLHKVPGSVLWLLDANPLAKENLRRAAIMRGIEPMRLVFAPKLSAEEHLARYVHADLFLDNVPVNAHTTASEALWSGLPVVTCAGEVFVGRVAASLLCASGVPELITETLADYEALAFRLATSPAKLAELRASLISARDGAPLFDTARYARNLEAAFAEIARLHRAGSPPAAFAVADL